MTDRALASARIVAQGLHEPSGAALADIVGCFVAMQGQDLAGAVASVALRGGVAAADVIEAFDRGAVVRAYPMRGTVFMMAADDALWVSELCNAAMVRAQIARRPMLGLEESHFVIAQEQLVRLASGGAVSRAELFAAWQDAGLETASGRGYHVLSHLVQTRFAVYGRWRDGDNLVHLAKDHLPASSTLEARFNGDRTAAAAELLRRYVVSRGPVTLRDAAWWSKLPLKLLRAAAGELGDSVEVVAEEELVYQRAGLADAVAAAGRAASAAMLLPGFDELILGYQDRSYIAAAEHLQKLVPGNNGVFRPTAIASGQVQGTWRRSGRPGKRRLELDAWRAVSETRLGQFERCFAEFPFAGE